MTPQTPEPTSDATPKPAVPERYEFKAPEGRELDATFIDRATPIFKELGLDNAAAQKLVDTYNDLAVDKSDLAVKAVNQMRQDWVRETESRFEAKGDALMEKFAPIGKMKDIIFAGDKAGREGFEKALNLTGAGDHPDVIATILKLAERVVEPNKYITGGGPSPLGQTQTAAPKPTAAQALYPNLPSSNRAA